MDLERAFIQFDTPLLRYINFDVTKLGSHINQLEIGFGNGEFLLNMAELFKEHTFFGIEYQKKYFAKALKWAQLRRLPNVKIFCSEAESTLFFIFPDNFFDTIHINFPDPWPKKRHAERRLVNNDFVKALKKVLKKEGKVYIASDVEQYFLNIVSLLTENGFRPLNYEENAKKGRPFKTKYEKAFLKDNKKIFYGCLKKS
ncbi:MAG: hypothetical protein OHK0040_02560 [bacterium]